MRVIRVVYHDSINLSRLVLLETFSAGLISFIVRAGSSRLYRGASSAHLVSNGGGNDRTGLAVNLDMA